MTDPMTRLGRVLGRALAPLVACAALVACTAPERLSGPGGATPCARAVELHTVAVADAAAGLPDDGLRGASGRLLARNLAVLARCPGLDVDLYGSAGRDEPAAQAVAHSERRAEAVRAFHVRGGLDPTRIRTSSGRGIGPRAGVPGEAADRDHQRRVDTVPRQRRLATPPGQ